MLIEEHFNEVISLRCLSYSVFLFLSPSISRVCSWDRGFETCVVVGFLALLPALHHIQMPALFALCPALLNDTHAICECYSAAEIMLMVFTEYLNVLKSFAARHFQSRVPPYSAIGWQTSSGRTPFCLKTAGIRLQHISGPREDKCWFTSPGSSETLAPPHWDDSADNRAVQLKLKKNNSDRKKVQCWNEMQG